MNIEDIYKAYALCDGNILFFQLDYITNRLLVQLKIRRLLPKEKFEVNTIKLEFIDITEVYVFEDFPTNGGYSDITLVKLDTEGFYMSLDPYGNTGLPLEKDNWVIKAKQLVLIDEANVRHHIS